MKRLFIPQPYSLLLCSGAIHHHNSRYTPSQLTCKPYLICSGLVAKGQGWLLDAVGVDEYNRINHLLKELPPYYLLTGLTLAIITFNNGRKMEPEDTKLTLKPYQANRYIHQVTQITLVRPFMFKYNSSYREIDEIDIAHNQIIETDRLQWRGLLFQHAKLLIGV